MGWSYGIIECKITGGFYNEFAMGTMWQKLFTCKGVEKNCGWHFVGGTVGVVLRNVWGIVSGRKIKKHLRYNFLN